jgi:Bacterial archaeo-eukaryotic release factor family 3
MTTAPKHHGKTAHRPREDAQSELLQELTGHELLELAGSGHAPRVSIYLPTPLGSSLVAQRIAWTNLVRSAERQLTSAGLTSGELRALLASTRPVVEAPNAGAQGVAHLASLRWSRAMSVAIQVPTAAVVGDRFYLRPLLPLLEPTGHYYLLGLSQDDVRFFAGNREHLKELSLDGLPLAPLASMPRGRHRAGAFVADRGSAGIRGAWHGVGGAVNDLDKQRIVAHFREVDAAVGKILRNRDAPLVLGGVGFLQAVYRAVNSYPVLMPEGIIGGLGDMTTRQLHERAWPLVEQTLHAERRNAVSRFTQLHGSGRTVSELSAAASAASEGRVETLIVAAADLGLRQMADVADSSAGTVQHDRMLLEEAVTGTLRHGGSIHVVEGASMPTSTSLAGVLRD